MRKVAKLLLASAILCSGLRASLVTLDLTPSGDISGNPGDTIGWGFSLINGSSDYLLISSTSFDVTTGDVAGSYSDYIGAFIAVAPLGTLSENFDSGLQTGVGGFLIYSSANRGDLAVGQLTITYDLFGEDPTSCDADSDPNCPGWAGEDTLTPAASVFVNTSDYSPPSDTPEPATLTMIGVGLLGFGFIRRRRARG